MKQPSAGTWALTKNALMKNSNIGVVVINWKDVSDEKQQEIINSLYKTNEDVISGMSYHEYRQETKELISKIPAFLEGKYEEKTAKSKQGTLF